MHRITRRALRPRWPHCFPLQWGQPAEEAGGRARTSDMFRRHTPTLPLGGGGRWMARYATEQAAKFVNRGSPRALPALHWPGELVSLRLDRSTPPNCMKPGTKP